MNAYTIACTTVLMATGAIADRFGRRRTYLASIVMFAITSLICGLAQSASVLIVSRFLQGMGGGAMLICQVAILSHQFQEGRERSKAFAAWGIIFGIGLGFGPIIGGLIAALSNWQWVFLVHFPLSIVALGLVFAGVQESRDPAAQHLDVPGVVMLSVSCFGLVYFITQGPDLGFGSRAALGIIAMTVLAFSAFIVVEKRSPRPMFDFSVFRNRAFSGAMFGSMGMNFSFWPFMIYLPIYFQGGLHYASVGAGLALLAYTLPALVVPPVAERLALRFDSRRVIPLGMVTIGLGFMLMKSGSSAQHADWLTMLPGCLLSGIGLGLTNTTVTNTATGSVSPDRAGMASGIDMSARLISLAINIAVMGFILYAGVLSCLRRALPGFSDIGQLRVIAERVAAGDMNLLKQGSPELTAMDPHGAIVHAALMHGFGLVMLYGGLGAWVLAVLSFVTFGTDRQARTAENYVGSTRDGYRRRAGGRVIDRRRLPYRQPPVMKRAQLMRRLSPTTTLTHGLH